MTTAFFFFCLDLSLVKVEDRMRGQVLTGEVYEADYFTFILSNGSYVRVLHEFGCEYGAQQSFKARCSPGRSSVHLDWS